MTDNMCFLHDNYMIIHIIIIIHGYIGILEGSIVRIYNTGTYIIHTYGI